MSEKILIIDDEQDIADLLEVYLKNENYIVYKFYCATDAITDTSGKKLRRQYTLKEFVWKNI